MSLVDVHGRPLESASFKKAKEPAKGEAFGQWAGRDVTFASLPGGGVVQFDLSKLTLADYRAMRDHYQVNASLSVLTFMQHQSDWHIECDDKKIAEHCEKNLREIWTGLNHSLGQANWAGYAPSVLQWENDLNNKTLQLVKVKDLIPEECCVKWKFVDGWAPPGRVPPKIKLYDGIKQMGAPYPIPVNNSYWYPLLMENGDYNGRKLLRPAFQSWFFSILLHLFANRYYERFGEPTPIGRAPFEDEIKLGETTSVPGNIFMLDVLKQLRSRSVVVLPNERTDMGNGRSEFDYDIEYLESQMRGADFERYMTRLDEEVSLGIFTPILLMRTADVGSYNLGVGHMQVWLWMLNALNADRKQYIDKYILSRMADFNFSEKAPRPKIVFKKMGDQNGDLIKAVLVELVKGGGVKPDLLQLGEMAGLTLKEVEILTDTNPANGDPRTDRQNPASDKGKGPKSVDKARDTTKKIAARVKPQIENAFRDGKLDAKITMGYQRQFEQALADDGFVDSFELTREFYGQLDHWLADILSACNGVSSDEFMVWFDKVSDFELQKISSAP